MHLAAFSINTSVYFERLGCRDVTYRPQYPGPSISFIYWSERPIGSAALGTRNELQMAWDRLCSADPDLEPWFLDAVKARTGETIWRIDDRVSKPSKRRTQAGDLTIYIGVDHLLDASEDELQRLMLWTWALAAAMYKCDSPPDAKGLLDGR